MGLLRRIKHDLRAGWATLRHETAHVANRALEEAELLRLRLDLRKLDDRIKELYRDIGERAVELHERGEPTERILVDLDIVGKAEQVQALQADRAKLLAEMEAARSPE